MCFFAFVFFFGLNKKLLKSLRTLQLSTHFCPAVTVDEDEDENDDDTLTRCRYVNATACINIISSSISFQLQHLKTNEKKETYKMKVDNAELSVECIILFNPTYRHYKNANNFSDLNNCLMLKD